MTMQHKFVEFMPDIIEDGVLYISLNYGTVIHNCACGCGSEVNTPLSPTGWRMDYNGETITLNPSIGNWSFNCKSHYWITDGKIEWASTWSDEKISKIRSIEDDEREKFYEKDNASSKILQIQKNTNIAERDSKRKWWLFRLLFGK